MPAPPRAEVEEMEFLLYYVSLSVVCRPGLTEDAAIHIGIILKNVASGSEKSHKLKMQFVTMVRSLLRGTQPSSRPLHFLLLTDPESVPYLRPVLEKFPSRDSPGTEVTWTFFDLGAIARRWRKEISALKPHFTSDSKQARKYADDLFLVAPFLHRTFPYSRLIMLDVDLVFRVSVEELYSQYRLFRDPGVFMGVANDLSPHYRHVLRFYREENPGTVAGEPGRMQGFNTGVVLYDLDSARRSRKLNDYIDNVGGCLTALAGKYKFKSHLGDQVLLETNSIGHVSVFLTPLSL